MSCGGLAVYPWFPDDLALRATPFAASENRLLQLQLELFHRREELDPGFDRNMARPTSAPSSARVTEPWRIHRFAFLFVLSLFR